MSRSTTQPNADPHRPPVIHAAGLPAAEQEAARHLTHSFMLLEEFASRFLTAGDIFHTSVRQSIFSQGRERSRHVSWSFLACRDGAMTINHFGRTIEHIMSYAGQQPTIFAMVDRKPIRSARKLLRKTFPKFEAMRNAVAHAADNVSTPDRVKRNRASGIDKAGPFLVNPSITLDLKENVFGTTFTSTYDGKLVSYEMTHETLQAIVDVKALIYLAFRSAEAQTHAAAAAARAAAPTIKGS